MSYITRAANGGSGDVGRSSARAEGHDDDETKCLSNDDKHNLSTRSSGSDNNNNSDPPLSEYELLRLRNIRRNEARLAQLGLLVPAAANKTQNIDNDATTSALTNMMVASPPQQSNKRKRRQDKTPIPRRILPKRRCAASRANDGYASDESSIASQILPKRILTLQPHQVAASDQDVIPRRERRGRPKLGDYEYICEEVCTHCGGEWKLDGDEAQEEETKLIRCKDCRGAFHLRCMPLHGKAKAGTDNDNVDAKDSLSARKENISLCDKSEESNTAEVIPKRCYWCERIKKKRTRKAITPVLEAIVRGKLLSVRIMPEPPIEAVIKGNDVACYVTLNGWK